MSLITRAEAKAQCRVTHDLEDDSFDQWIETADERIKQYLNQDQIPVNAQTKAAARLIVQELWERGEKDYTDAINALLFPYRVEMGI